MTAQGCWEARLASGSPHPPSLYLEGKRVGYTVNHTRTLPNNGGNTFTDNWGGYNKEGRVRAAVLTYPEVVLDPAVHAVEHGLHVAPEGGHVVGDRAQGVQQPRHHVVVRQVDRAVALRVECIEREPWKREDGRGVVGEKREKKAV